MSCREPDKARSRAIDKAPLIKDWRIIVRDRLRWMPGKDSFHVGKKRSNPFCFHGEQIASCFAWSE